MLHTWLPVILSKLLSILQATTLRDRYYTAVNRIELLETAIEDIERINTSHTEDATRLIDTICKRVKPD
jgi:hypothetical protein